MPIKTDSLNRDLYKLLKVRGYDPIPKGSDGETVPVPDEAEVFKFTFKKDGKPIDSAWVTIDSNQDLKIYYDDGIADSTTEDLDSGSFDNSWTGFLQQLKMWSQRRQLGFDTENKDHLASDMAQRDHMKKKENIAEGYYPMGKQASYSDAIPSVKIILQHNRKLEEGEQRYRNISRIFVENANGERFLLNTTKPGLARVYARHIAEGGTPYDDRANHIQSLVEEYEKMAGFVRATRNGQFNESTQRLVLEGANHYQSLRETLSRMTGRRGYNMYFESWTPALMEDDGEVSGINELFVQETLDPRIESAMPILKKLHKKLGEMKEVTQLEEWADSLVNEYKQGDDSGYIQLLQSKLKAGKPLTNQEKEKLKAYLAAKNLGLKEEGDGGQTALNPIGIPEEELDEGTGAIRKFLAGLGIIGALGAHISSEDEAIIQRMAVKYDQAQTPQEKAQIKRDIERVTKGSLVKEEDIEESGLQAYLGNKKYGEKGMDALRKAGREGASKEKMASIRAKYDKLDEEGMEEGYTVTRGIDKERYQERQGLEGPFSTKSGKVVYYDKREGKYYDPDTDMYIEYDDWKAMNEQGVAEGSLNEGQYEMMMRNGQVKKFIAKDDADAKRIAAGHGAKSVIRLKGGVPAGKIAEQGVSEGHADQQRKIFKKNGQPVGEVGIDRESSPGVGQWYMKCYAYDIDNSGYDSYEEAVAELKDCLKQGVAEGLSEMDNRTPSGDRREQRANSPEAKAQREKEQQERLKKVSPEMRKKLGLPEPKEQGVAEDLDANQKRVGQLGPYEKVGPKGAVGKLVGASENFINTTSQSVVSEMDKSQPSSDRGGESSGDPYAKGGKATPVKAKDAAKDAEKAMNKAMDKAHKKDVKEGQEDLDTIKRLLGK